MEERAASILGNWQVTINTPMGAQVVQLEFTDDHTGVARYGSDSVPLENVAVNGNSVTCTVRVAQPMAVTLTCALTVNGDSMTGTASAGFFGKFALNGRRGSGS
jgi:phage repressor protein C with HTH and peptisase S24 domain